MGIKNVLAKAGGMLKPVTRATGKVLKKLDKNKPEIMLVAGIVMVIGGAVTAVVKTMKVRDVMDESHEEMAKIEAEHEGLVMDMEGNQVAPITDDIYKKKVTKLRLDTGWKLVRIYDIPSLAFLIGLGLIVKGHAILKDRYVMTMISLKGTQEVLDFVKQNVIKDQGEGKWKEYRYGKAEDEPVTLKIADDNGNTITSQSHIMRTMDHDNPWRIEYCEELFDSWKGNPEANLFFLQGVEKHWNENKYQANKDAEISMFEILDYLRFKWEKVPKEYREWLRTNGWAHHVYGDDAISFGLQMPINDATRRRLSDKIYIEFNAEGALVDLINRYREGDAPAKKPVHAGEYLVRGALGL